MSVGQARRRAPVSVPITLSEEDGVRYLHFGTPWVQGAMRLARPDEPVLEYIRQMMGWLLFLEPPGHILQLGVGAGALTRFCLRHCAGALVTAVDSSEAVIETAHQWFALPRAHPRLAVVSGDAMDYLEGRTAGSRFGVIQVDLYDMHARGPAIESAAFYRVCAAALAQTGIAVFNLFGAHESTERNLRRIRHAFGDRVLALPQCSAGNLVVLGFAGPPLQVEWSALEARADLLRRRLRLPATDWVAALRRSARTPDFRV